MATIPVRRRIPIRFPSSAFLVGRCRLFRWLCGKPGVAMSDLDRILELFNTSAKLDRVLANQEKIMSALSDLQAAVTAEDTVLDSAIVLLKGLKDALDQAGTDPAALAALSADIQAKTAALAAAIAANTPAA